MNMNEWEQDRLLEISNATSLTASLLEEAEQPDLATRVAADLFVESFAISTEGSSDDRYINHVARECIRAGRIFAEAVNQATQPQNAAEKDKP